MPVLNDHPILDAADLARFEAQMSLAQRLPERSVYDVFVGAAERWPARTALTMLMSGAADENPRRVNYAELLQLVRRAANLFTRLAGPRPGVAYLLPSLIETHAALWGASSSGYAVPLNFLLQVEHLAALIEASGARILVALGPHPALDIWQKALQLRARLPGLTLLRVAPPGAPAEPGVLDFNAALAAEPAEHLSFAAPGRDDEVAAYFHTGGTTGTPRLVAHTHRGQLVAALGGAVLGDMRVDDVATATLPLFHVGGTIYCSLSAFMVGMENVVMSPSGLRNPAMVQGFWRLVEQYRVTRVGGVPTSLGAVLDVPLNGADISRVRAGFTGAASLPPAVGERFRQLTGRGLYEVYGMTEASGLIAIDAIGSAGAPGSVGLALPYTRAQVHRLGADGTPGEVCAPGEVGVIVVSGAHVAPGYREPAHNAGVFEAGRLNSGDLGYTDAQGRLHIAGRTKDLIIRSGHNIDPVMIEAAMATHPAVALAAAVGMPDAYAGELPLCFVTLRAGAQVNEDELHEHAREHIGERPAWPRRIHIVETIPLTSVGKIFKPELRCTAAVHVVQALLANELKLADARVQAESGGARGLRVNVTLPAALQAAVPRVEQALAAYLFEARVMVGSM